MEGTASNLDSLAGYHDMSTQERKVTHVDFKLAVYPVINLIDSSPETRGVLRARDICLGKIKTNNGWTTADTLVPPSDISDSIQVLCDVRKVPSEEVHVLAYTGRRGSDDFRVTFDVKDGHSYATIETALGVNHRPIMDEMADVITNTFL